MTAQLSGKVLTKVLLVAALTSSLLLPKAWAQTQLSSSAVPKFVDQLPLPSQPMPKVTTSATLDYYEIAARQVQTQMLSTGTVDTSGNQLMTTVWAYGPASDPGTANFLTPALPIAAVFEKPVRVKWINDLVCHDPVANACTTVGQFVSYPAGVPASTDNHWANPPQLCDHGAARTDCKGNGGNYFGPVPLVTHLHGVEGPSESDGIPEAWNLPNASAAGFSTAVYFPHGSDYCQINPLTGARAANCPNAYNNDGSALFQYANHQWPTILAFHDHSLGVTEQNVYMGLAGAYVLFTTDTNFDALRNFPGTSGGLPFGDCLDPNANFFASQHCYEKPLIIQDKTFDTNGNLLLRDQGNMILVNGRTWPYLEVEPRKYRFHIANLASSNVFVLTFGDPGTGPPITLIGGDQGFLRQPAMVNRLSLSSAERADVIVDFSIYAWCAGLGFSWCGGAVNLLNDNGTGDTSQVMQFRVDLPLNGTDTSSIPSLPSRNDLIVDTPTPRKVGIFDNLLGDVVNGVATPMLWDAPSTQNPVAGTTEIWEMWDYQDSHPMHLHSVAFQVMNRENMTTGQVFNCNGTAKNHFGNTVNCSSPPRPLETGFKDTVLVSGNQITRVKIKFTDGLDTPHPGLFAWHCHFTPHEDNEMMRPMCVQRTQGAAGQADGFSPGGCPTQ